MKKMVLLSAGIAAAAFAATPAAAQYPYGYPNYNNNGQNVVGQIINSVLGYGRYPYGNYGYGQPQYMASQVAVDQCARAVEARLNNQAMNTQYNRWNPYNNPYSSWARQGAGRVLGIDNVRVKSSGKIKVRGVATSGHMYAQGYGYGGYSYNRQYGTPDIKFSCNADRSGRVYDVNLNRQSYYGRWR